MAHQVQVPIKLKTCQVLSALYMNWSMNLNQTGLHLVRLHRIYLLPIKQVRSLCIILFDINKDVDKAMPL